MLGALLETIGDAELWETQDCRWRELSYTIEWHWIANWFLASLHWRERERVRAAGWDISFKWILWSVNEEIQLFFRGTSESFEISWELSCMKQGLKNKFLYRIFLFFTFYLWLLALLDSSPSYLSCSLSGNSVFCLCTFQMSSQCLRKLKFCSGLKVKQET